MYVDPRVLEREKNIQRLKDFVVLLVLVFFLVLEYRSARHLLIRMTHNLVATETVKINYIPSEIGFWKNPAVHYQWKGIEYEAPVRGLFLANSATIVPPVKVLVDPDDPQTSILKTPHGGWAIWTFDFVLLQGAFAGFLYIALVGPYRIRRKSYFQ